MNNDRKMYIISRLMQLKKEMEALQISRLMQLKKEMEALQKELAEISMEESGVEDVSKQFLVENS